MMSKALELSSKCLAGNIIIDFYNCYCSFINFRKNKQFSIESFFECFSAILECSRNCEIEPGNIIIISKNIFEVPESYIIQLTQKFSNVIYAIVADNEDVIKSTNRERDDFVCIMLHKILDNSVIISNDTFKNYNKLINKIKPFHIMVYRRGASTLLAYDNEQLNKIRSNLQKEKKINRIGYKYRRITSPCTLF